MPPRRVVYRPLRPRLREEWSWPNHAEDDDEEANAPRYASSHENPRYAGLTWLEILNEAIPDPKANDTEKLANILCDPEARATLRELDWHRLGTMLRDLQKPDPRQRGPRPGRRSGPAYEPARQAARQVLQKKTAWRRRHRKKLVPGWIVNQWISDAARNGGDVVDALRLEQQIKSELKNPQRL